MSRKKLINEFDYLVSDMFRIPESNAIVAFGKFRMKLLAEAEWKPKKGEIYWLISLDGVIFSETWESKEYGNFNNCFKSKEQAEKALELVKQALKKAREE